MSPTKVDNLSVEQEYKLLKFHRVPSSTYVFPTTLLGGLNCSFQRKWLQEHPWMVYSEVCDGAFCIACVLFCSNRSVYSISGRRKQISVKNMNMLIIIKKLCIKLMLLFKALRNRKLTLQALLIKIKQLT